jgi:hypothetical protein
MKDKRKPYLSVAFLAACFWFFIWQLMNDHDLQIMLVVGMSGIVFVALLFVATFEVSEYLQWTNANAESTGPQVSGNT